MSSVVLGTPALLPALPDLSDAKRRLFEAAIRLFGQRGYHGVSVRDIATELGLKPMSLYAHVASKQDLLFEIMSVGYATHRDRFTGALLDAGREPEEQIRAITRAHVLVHLEFPALARVISREMFALTPEHAEAVTRVSDEAVKVFRDVVERGQRLGVFKQEDVALVVHAVAAMGTSTANWWTPSSGTSATHLADKYADYAVRLLT